MKTLKLRMKMAAMLLVFATGFAFANNPDVLTKENNYKEIRTQIENKMSVPDFIREENETQKVFVSFSLEKDGTIKVLGTKGENKELNIFVEQKLNGEKINSVSLDSAQTFNIELKFRLL